MANLIIRVQSCEGTIRVKTSSGETLSTFLSKVAEQLSIPKRGWSVYTDRSKSTRIESSSRKTVASVPLKHGDMVYLFKTGAGVSNVTSEVSLQDTKPENQVEEDEIDVLLSKQDGLIHRKRDPHMCHHGDNSKCVHCVPLEPYDETFLKEHDPPIKHMSLHAYFKKWSHGIDKGKFTMLKDISCKIKEGCAEHPPWPGGICTKCQPTAITLKRQDYRHVDNILFENPSIVQPFLDYWRRTGNQRLGFLYGRYEEHKDVPLGIRAVVAAIYEPPQEGTPDSLELLPNPNLDTVNKLAADLGLRIVGWIFSDLVPDDVKKGTVKHLRDINTHFLTAEECIMAGDFQNQYVSPCRYASSGKFGSKFVTVVVSEGNDENQIGFDGFQVSNQCMALVRDDCLVPTLDDPGLGYIRESSSEQYVPDVFYKDTDSYGNEVTLLARPMPIEYLLVQVSAAFPVQPVYTFSPPPSNGAVFPIENRENIGELQDFDAVRRHLSQYPPGNFLSAMSNFHLLVFLATNDMLPLKTHMEELCAAIKNKDAEACDGWRKGEQWGTVEQIIAAHGKDAPSPGPFTHGPIGDVDMEDMTQASRVSSWTCKHCTFINHAMGSCEMCGLPQA
ncbi:predicted protein [Nematostella vectensis]|uniref:Nuclear protein localization protein 4 homolog n=1 Tax=Nematostella vectensis TaxID=45351 RepID=A7T2C7_NEMVE|nr:predicted protein [Nematostella vectensis]|eukprot:XP_001621988.1 hypothetical protein NEMVEDRAFT_v1g176363 [Nematostella vectensis]